MRYFFGFLVAIGLVILVVFLLFSGGGKPKTVVTPRTLTSYTNFNDAVRLTIDGPINADQNHQSIQITINDSDVVFDHIQGYEGTVVNQQTFANNDNAFVNFLFALNHAGFTEGNTAKSLSDERGYCPLGDRYVFELMEGGDDVQRYWATSCGGTKTYLGALTLTINLFQSQVPGYSQLVDGISL